MRGGAVGHFWRGAEGLCAAPLGGVGGEEAGQGCSGRLGAVCWQERERCRVYKGRAGRDVSHGPVLVRGRVGSVCAVYRWGRGVVVVGYRTRRVYGDFATCIIPSVDFATCIIPTV